MILACSFRLSLENESLGQDMFQKCFTSQIPNRISSPSVSARARWGTDDAHLAQTWKGTWQVSRVLKRANVHIERDALTVTQYPGNVRLVLLIPCGTDGTRQSGH
jgi:hypothetical protein